MEKKNKMGDYYTVFVGNIPSEANENDIVKVFRHVTKCVIPASCMNTQKQKYAFVSFDSEENMKKALSEEPPKLFDIHLKEYVALCVNTANTRKEDSRRRTRRSDRERNPMMRRRSTGRRMSRERERDRNGEDARHIREYDAPRNQTIATQTSPERSVSRANYRSEGNACSVQEPIAPRIQMQYNPEKRCYEMVNPDEYAEACQVLVDVEESVDPEPQNQVMYSTEYPRYTPYVPNKIPEEYRWKLQ